VYIIGICVGVCVCVYVDERMECMQAPVRESRTKSVCMCVCVGVYARACMLAYAHTHMCAYMCTYARVH